MRISARLLEGIVKGQQLRPARFLRSFIGDLSNVEIDRLLRHNERQTRFNDGTTNEGATKRIKFVPIDSLSGAVLNYESNQLAANKPCEDHFAEAECLKTKSHLFAGILPPWFLPVISTFNVFLIFD